jgi:hypothetical protein
MALLESEITALRWHLGYNVLDAGAEPYVSIVAVFDSVIATYLRAGAATTSSTSVAASATAEPVALTLASATGVSEGATVIVDVDARQERATVQALSGTDITVLLKLAHGGTYPVTVEGGESIIRDLLGKLRTIGDTIAASGMQAAGVKVVDEIEFFGDRDSRRAQLIELQAYYRQELADALGVANLRAVRAGQASGLLEAY